MVTLKTKSEKSKVEQELGDETFMSADDLRTYMTEIVGQRVRIWANPWNNGDIPSMAWTGPARRARN